MKVGGVKEAKGKKVLSGLDKDNALAEDEESKSDELKTINVEAAKLTCNICYEDLDSIKAVIDCGHYYCT